MTGKYWRRVGALGVLAVIAVIIISPGFLREQEVPVGELPKASTPAESAEGAISTDQTAELLENLKAEVSSPEPSPQERIIELEDQLRDTPFDYDALTELGALYFGLRLYPRAADMFTRALDVRPGDSVLYNDLGSALLYQGMLELAKQYYTKSIESDPTLPDPHFNLAVIRSHANPPDIEAALAGWQEVIRLAPESDIAQTAIQYIEGYEGTDTPGTDVIPTQ